ncbi:hypothetical protein B0I35DRAFT_474789 [Stachybotrys elegans]|uniref:Uncharacterized protein n=1 Tax=Stachybotrys elegans TaxID=80388 RepID=A0A8K0SZ54_9HYPO|nr:hypothetical protein B0I35DRAFT_474789 [Stachybotrys elegans]
MNRYWIPHHDIHKKVITQELQYHLGPQATVRSYTFEGEDGYLISTPGCCLTDEQIDDICQKSKELWDRQTAAKAMENPGKELKRPLHQPVLVTRGAIEMSRRREARRGQGGHRRPRDR